MNLQPPSLLLQIAGTARETRDGGKTNKRSVSQLEGSERLGEIRLSLLPTIWINHRDHLPASTNCARAGITATTQHKSRIPAHGQQIVIGIPFTSHQMPSYPLQQRGAPSGWTGGHNLLTSLSPWKEHAPFQIHKGQLPFVNLNIKRGWHGAPWLLKADSHSFYQAGVWWSIIKAPTLVTLSRRWNWGSGGLWRGNVFPNLDGGETVEMGERILFT